MPTIMSIALNHFAAAAELPVVRLTRIPRHACVLAVAVTAGVLSAAAPAAADVTASPPTATQGAASNETFRVVNDHPTAAMTKIKLVLPPATPVAEVYPLSVDDWAPTITNRPLNPPMQGVHGGSPLTEATASITWTAAPGKALAPGKAADVMIAIGPLPETDQMAFEVQATYADGSAGPAIAPAVLKLTPAAVDPADVAPVEESMLFGSEDQVGGGGAWSVAGWIIALLAAIVAVIAVIRSRSGVIPGDGAGSPTESGAEDVTDQAPPNDQKDDAHRARVSAWSYRDGP
jgi:hypothetical protein